MGSPSPEPTALNTEASEDHGPWTIAMDKGLASDARGVRADKGARDKGEGGQGGREEPGGKSGWRFPQAGLRVKMRVRGGKSQCPKAIGCNFAGIAP